MKLIGYIGIVLMVLVVGCNPHTTSPRPSPGGEGVASRTLENNDSLMWRQPDSAFAMLQEFASSEAADSLDVFEGHYCQVLIAELLYKNYYKQSNRNFQIITFLPNKKSRDKTRRPPQNLLTSNLYH